jgi:predicted flavoprotein YhiN
MPVKYINVRHGETEIKGDIMLTPWGVEGTPIYSLSHSIQKEILENGTGHLEIYIDLKPDLNLEQISEKLKGKKSISTKLKALLSGQAILLLRELTSKEDYLDEKIIASKIKNLKLKLTGPRPIEEAISTGGGVDMKEITDNLSLKNFSNIYVGGEMLSWGAPTGGYLLQGCFTQGYIIAKSIKDKATIIK